MSRKFRPSPALVISILALVLAASGTAMAASKLVSGDSLIKQGSLSGNRLRNGTVTGKQIKASSLGQVPSAAKAVSATTAGTATTATTATTAGSAPISTVTYVTSTGSVPYNTNTGTPDAITATCPTGTTVIGGGASVSDEDFGEVNDSFPSGQTGWTADFFNAGSTVNGTVTAICAPAAATAT